MKGKDRGDDQSQYSSFPVTKEGKTKGNDRATHPSEVAPDFVRLSIRSWRSIIEGRGTNTGFESFRY
jgi:hypothetical protein